MQKRSLIFIAVGLLLAVVAGIFWHIPSGTETDEEPPVTPVVIDLTSIPLVLNDVIFNLERKILEAEYGELKNGELTADKAKADEYFEDLSDLFEAYTNTYQPEKARRAFIRGQALLGDESRPPEYQGPVAWEFENPVELIHEGFALTVENVYGDVSSLFFGTPVTYTLDPAANFFSLLKIKINDPVEIENIAFDVSGAAGDIVFKLLGDNGEVPVLHQGEKISVDVSGFTRTLEIAVVYPIPESVTISRLVITMREVTAETLPGPKSIG